MTDDLSPLDRVRALPGEAGRIWRDLEERIDGTPTAHETWTQGNDEDELRAVCSCGWAGPWQDRIRAAYDDQTEHHRAAQEESA